MSGIIEQLRQRRQTDPGMFPESPAGKWAQTAQAADAAEAALDGVVMFYGDKPIRTGRRDIDWSGSHRKHQEWRAQLNRFMMLYPLCAGYRNTKDEKYARAARDYIEDWLDAHQPYPTQPDMPRPAPGDSTLNMAVRLGSTRHPGWLMALVDLDDSGAFDEAFVERVVSSMVWQLDWLAMNLPAGANWRIAALDCLFSQAFRLPERFGKHLSGAVDGLNTEFATQILPDGAHLERSAGYNDWMC
ncbi:unnamed protein product, partial [marine sediment metagenome]